MSVSPSSFPAFNVDACWDFHDLHVLFRCLSVNSRCKRCANGLVRHLMIALHIPLLKLVIRPGAYSHAVVLVDGKLKYRKVAIPPEPPKNYSCTWNILSKRQMRFDLLFPDM